MADPITLDALRQALTTLLEAEDPRTVSPQTLGLPSVDAVLFTFVDALNRGVLRAASRGDDGQWRVDPLVKRSILLGFKLGQWTEVEAAAPFQFSDKHTYVPQTLALEARNIRLVPGGTTVRAGSYLGHNVTVMPPSYLNVGTYVDDGTLVDSHVLVGSCAQIGKRCHLSAAVQIGGVLEPVGQLPVIVEDDVFIGGNAGIYEGTIIREGAVLASGTILTRSTRVYDLVNETILAASADAPLEIPAGAVVVPGSRPASSDFAKQHQLQLYTPVIVKYRDAKTAASTTLEEALR